MSFEYLPGATVEVPEIPYKSRVQLPAARTAVIVVDMQNDFVTPGGSLVVPAAAGTAPAIQRLLAAARAAGVRVACVRSSSER